MQDLESAVQRIQQGDERKREELITSQKIFIFKYTCFICKKTLSWQNDDELSIALIAFGEAYIRRGRPVYSHEKKVIIKYSYKKKTARRPLN